MRSLANRQRQWMLPHKYVQDRRNTEATMKKVEVDPDHTPNVPEGCPTVVAANSDLSHPRLSAAHTQK